MGGCLLQGVRNNNGLHFLDRAGGCINFKASCLFNPQVTFSFYAFTFSFINFCIFFSIDLMWWTKEPKY